MPPESRSIFAILGEKRSEVQISKDIAPIREHHLGVLGICRMMNGTLRSVLLEVNGEENLDINNGHDVVEIKPDMINVLGDTVLAYREVTADNVRSISDARIERAA